MKVRSVRLYVCIYVSVYVCMYAFIDVCTYICMYACVHVCVCMCICLYIYVYIYIFSYRSREYPSVALELLCLFIKARKVFGNANTPENCFGLGDPVRVIFCSSESYHDKQTAPSTKLFVSATRLQEKWAQPRNYVLSSSVSEEIFCTLESRNKPRRMKHGRTET
jgi:hypothetical protein